MLRVGFDRTGIALDQGGGARIAEGMARAVAGRVERVDLVMPRVSGSSVLQGLARELWWYPSGLPRAARGLDVLHCPLPLAPPRGGVPVVVTIHDALAFDRPEWFTRANRVHARTLLRHAARRAALVHTTSEHSRAALARALDVDPSRIVVIPPGVDERFTPGPAPSGEPYVLTVGTLQPRKNLDAVIAAVERLDIRLVIAGGRGWHDAPLVERIRRSPAADRIRLAGRVDDDELVALYRGASAFVFPSLGEGFGLPPLEAMACGTAVVCSTATSLPEVVGDAAVPFDPHDGGALERELGALLADDARRAALAAAGPARAAQFTWERCGERLLAAYERAAGG